MRFISQKTPLLAIPPQFDGLPGNDLSCFGDRKVVLITGHRRENFGDGFEDICRAITTLVETQSRCGFCLSGSP